MPTPHKPTDLILDALAVSEDGLTLTALARVLSLAGVRIGGRRPTSTTIQNWLAELIRKKLASHPGRVEPTHPQAELRARVLIKSGRYEEVAAWVAQAEPLEPPSRWGIENARPGTLARELRRAFVRGDMKAVEQLQRRKPSGLWHWFCEPVDTELLQTLQPPISAYVLRKLSQTSFHHARPAPGLRQLIYQTALDQPALLETAAFEAILTGEQDRADALLGRMDKKAGMHTRALRALLDGDVEGATKLYAKGLTADRKRQGSNKAFPQEDASLFLPLVYLLSSAKSRGPQALRLIEQARRVGLVRPALPWGGWEHLPALDDASYTDGDPCEHPAAVLLEGLCAWWRGEPLDAARRGAAVEAAEACGWGWIADELVCSEAGEGLGGLREVRARWAERLGELEALLSEESAPTGTREGAGKRLAWFLTVGDGWVDLDAREQVSRGAGWSKGRKVSCARLLGSGTPPVTTPADKAIIAALRYEDRTYRGYPDIYYFWEPDALWPALVGHPAVFDEAGSPLTIVSVEPRLLRRRSGGASTIVVDPPIAAGRVRAVKVGNGYEVTALNDKQAQFAEIVGDGMVIPAGGTEALERVLDAAQGLFAGGESRTRAAAARTVPATSTVSVRLYPEGRGLAAELVVLPTARAEQAFTPGLGSPIVLDHRDGEAVRLRRDLEAEADNMETLLAMPGLSTAQPAGDRWLLAAPADGLALLEALSEAQIPVFWPEKAALRFRRTVRAADLRLQVHEVKDWFQASGSLDIDDGLALSLRALLAKVLSSDSRFIQLDDGSFIALQASLKRDLEALARTAQARKGEAVAVHPLASRALVSMAGDALTACVTRKLDALAEIPERVPVPAGLKTSLRGYQDDAFQWLARLAHTGVGALLADDMGLGKTVVSLALLLHRRQRGPALIVVPTSVAGNWEREAVRFAPSLRTLRIRHAADRAAMVAGLKAGDALICSYGLLVSEAQLLQSRDWATVIFDESQALKNTATKRHRAAAKLRAEMRLALTGTPIENHLGELYAHFAILNPGMLGGRQHFQRHFQRPIEDGQRAVQRQLKALVSPYLLRRTKGQVLDDLPERIDINLPVELGPAEAALYEAQRRAALAELEDKQETDSAISLLSHLTRLRLLACSPKLVVADFPQAGAKLATFASIAAKLREGGHRALVFSQFVKHLTLLRAWLNDQKIPHHYLDGATPAQQREKEIEAFQSGDAPFFLISTRAGGQGLNLTAADYVLHMDPWWNPAVEDQATGRAHRIGQRRPVTVYRLYAQGTVEEQILTLHQKKRSVAAGILEGADTATRLSAAELLELMHAGVSNTETNPTGSG